MANYIVITGASSGIGCAAARAFAQRGKHLILTARRLQRLETLKAELSETYPALNILVKYADLSVPKEADAFYDSLKDYPLETWINNAGFGYYSCVADQIPGKTAQLLHLNVEALTLLSLRFVHDYQNCPDAQLINISSTGGYIIVSNAVTYCASKFYVSAFTEGLARELQIKNAALRAKVLAPAATKTEFGQVANNTDAYDYDKYFTAYHSSQEMAQFLIKLYDSDKTVGIVDRETFQFQLCDPLLPYAAH